MVLMVGIMSLSAQDAGRLSNLSTRGIGLVELYDGSAEVEPCRLVNLSTRGRVGTGNALLVPGIAVTNHTQDLLIRGVGPELAESYGFSAENVLPDPILVLLNQSGETVARNDDWGSHPDAEAMMEMAESVGAFPLTAGSKDAALWLPLNPGIYTAQVSDATGGEGVAIVEVYAVPYAPPIEPLAEREFYELPSD